jgi:hypothetical protein
MINRYALHEETTSLNMVMLRSRCLPLGCPLSPLRSACFSASKKTVLHAFYIAGAARRGLLQRGGATSGPFLRCSACPRRAPIHLACCGGGGLRLHPQIHLALLAGRGGMRMHLHPYPPHTVGRKRRPAPLQFPTSRSWPPATLSLKYFGHFQARCNPMF